MKLIIFTDLDGTLLDDATYSYEKTLPALELLKREGIPVIFCSSKTKAEIEYYRIKLSNTHPFVVENGGGIFIPRGYFSFPVSCPPHTGEEHGSYYRIATGTPYSFLREAILELQREGYCIRGFGDMSSEELAELTGLDIDTARKAKERDFDEPFLFRGEKEQEGALLAFVAAKGLHLTRGGRFFHLTGENDKGKAVSCLIGLYRKQGGGAPVITAALGDGPNDIPMLRQVDYPIVVRRPGGGDELRICLPHLIRAEGTGPEGWSEAVLRLLERLS
ncbi:MAG: HAD-IIB family hydrolase [Alphaproteobacteria bacterium]|uniref:HAD-IIB family hydrolase n=1 Tax=Candidatus Nitrobium versatile TaxID=2884831 RepID=A0A953JCC0_9BACT|nr:HAD-IIB family hydrolase [Candidatus Nitrobium versatile]